MAPLAPTNAIEETPLIITVNVTDERNTPLAPIAEPPPEIGGGGVSSINGLKGDVTLAGGSNIIISQLGQVITITALGGGGGGEPQSPWLSNINANTFNLANVGSLQVNGSATIGNGLNVTGQLLLNGVALTPSPTLVAGMGITLTPGPGTITISETNPGPTSPGGGEGAVQFNHNGAFAGGGLRWFDFGAELNWARPGQAAAIALTTGGGIEITATGGLLTLPQRVDIITDTSPTALLTVDGDVDIKGLYKINGVPIGGGGGVSSINGITGGVTLAAGSNVSISPSGNTITISATGGGGGGSQTPWLSDIDGNGKSLSHVLNISSQGYQLKIPSASSSLPRWNMTTAGPSFGEGTNTGDNWTLFRYDDAGNQFPAAAVTILRNSGFVGIGTESPSFALEVSPTMRVSQSSATANANFQMSAGSNIFTVTLSAQSQAATPSLLSFVYANEVAFIPASANLRLFQNGNIGMGLSAAGFKLDVGGGINSNLAYYLNGSPFFGQGSYMIWSNDNQTLTFSSPNNIGAMPGIQILHTQSNNSAALMVNVNGTQLIASAGTLLDLSSSRLLISASKATFNSLPTSASGLTAGDIWNNNGVVNIV